MTLHKQDLKTREKAVRIMCVRTKLDYVNDAYRSRKSQLLACDVTNTSRCCGGMLLWWVARKWDSLYL
jgi:hypothetical protein